jgi:hypothetical protein
MIFAVFKEAEHVTEEDLADDIECVPIVISEPTLDDK